MHLHSQVLHQGATVKGSADVQVIRSTDKGETWSKRATTVAPVHEIGESDPEPIQCRPFITGNPPCTIVRSDGVIIDLAVDTSSPTAPDSHPGRLYVAWQDHQDNPRGDVSAGSPVRRALEPGGRTCASSATRPCSQRSRSSVVVAATSGGPPWPEGPTPSSA